MPLTTRRLLLGLLLLLVLAGLATLLVRPTTRAVLTYYVSQVDGADSRTCDQARSASAPLRSINRGNACLHPGDILVIGPGTYDELLLSQQSSSRECSASDAAVQPGCATIPNGLSASQPTTLRASGPETMLSPIGRQLPGGGSAITLLDYARYIHIEGLRIVQHSAAGSTGGVYIGNAQHITITGNTLDDGQIKGGASSRYLQVTKNRIFNTGKTTCPPDQKPTPKGCPHGMYICGTDHTISDNYVHNTSYYGIQVSCEAGGIARIRLERNRVEYNAGVGIRCAGEDCLVAANVLRGNGQGITLTGSGLVANNTIDGYLQASWNADPAGIWTTWGDGAGFTITNNILTGMKNSYLAIGNAANTPADPGKVHHNLCEAGGNTGCPLVAPASAVYADVAAGDFTLQPGSPAIRAGVAHPQVTQDLRGVAYPAPPDLGAYSSQGSPPPADTLPPTVRITNPPNNAQVFGTTVMLEATASDDVAVVQVIFQVDGQHVGTPQHSAPYRATWDTTTLGNGPHAVSAVAHDAAGKQAVSTITVQVHNPSPPEPAPGQPVLACSGTIQGSALAFTCHRPQGVR